jgi:hypothetical protein
MRFALPLLAACLIAGCGSDQLVPITPSTPQALDFMSATVNGNAFVSDSISGSFTKKGKFGLVTAYSSANPQFNKVTLFFDGYTRAGNFTIDGFGAGVFLTRADGSTISIQPPMQPGLAGDCCWYSYGTIRVTTLTEQRITGSFDFSYEGISGSGTFDKAIKP